MTRINEGSRLLSPTHLIYKWDEPGLSFLLSRRDLSYTLGESFEKSSTLASTTLLSCDSATMLLMKSQQQCGEMCSAVAVGTTSTLCTELHSTLLRRKRLQLLLILAQHLVLRIISHLCGKTIYTFC